MSKPALVLTQGVVPSSRDRCPETARVEVSDSAACVAVRCRESGLEKHDDHRGTDGVLWIAWDATGEFTVTRADPDAMIPTILDHRVLRRGVFAHKLPASIEWYET